MKRRTMMELVSGYEAKRFTPVEITIQYLKTIKAKNPKLNAYITITKELALRQAQMLEMKLMAGEQTGQLFGVPLSYKDNFATKGILTSSGSFIDRNFIPDKNAAVVQQMATEDAITLGKTNMHEYAFGITSNNPHYGPVRNPWNPQYTPGGSSGGSGAAVAANMCVASLGSDTGGSVRIPAASCGVIGLKPTYGTISTEGVFPISWTLDTVGPITANMNDLAVMMEALTNRAYTSFLVEDIRGMRIGVPANYFNERIDPETYKLYLQAVTALSSLGAILIDVDLPFLEGNQEAVLTIATAEGGYVHQSRMECCLSQYGADVREILESSANITAVQYIAALKKKEGYIREFQRVFERIDVLATPTLPIPPRKIGVEEVQFGSVTETIFDTMTRYTGIFSLAEVPAMSIPCGITSEGLPVGLQLVAGLYREDQLIRTGYAFEQSQLADFYKKRDSLET
ncbi:amidase [Paenibacillus sp. MER TA 81-3]|uniref:amidase n=1 Tax=Paenibacillus sp. MER TA 81-3 TaxID=2939573 RepID=UPI00203CAC3E|nr:amidase [Paenibacillus sp. MER TA 81-3]MCM3340770.1 amidase [Paenibacillus sp. MER TA 81-3]